MSMEWLDAIQTGGAVGIFAVFVQAVKWIMKEKVVQFSCDIYTAKRNKQEMSDLKSENDRLRCHQKFLEGELQSCRSNAMKAEKLAVQWRERLDKEREKNTEK